MRFRRGKKILKKMFEETKKLGKKTLNKKVKKRPERGSNHVDHAAPYTTSPPTLVNKFQLKYGFTAKLREAFLFQVPNLFGIFLISFAILKNLFANPLKKVANLLMEFAMFLS